MGNSKYLYVVLHYTALTTMTSASAAVAASYSIVLLAPQGQLSAQTSANSFRRKPT